MASVELIFSKLVQHIITGLMIHDQYESYYSFLNLPAYAKCHKGQYDEENNTYYKLKCHYMKMHNKLIVEQPVDNPHAIPSG